MIILRPCPSMNSLFPFLILLAASLSYRCAATETNIFTDLLLHLGIKVLLVGDFPSYEYQHIVINLLLVFKWH